MNMKEEMSRYLRFVDGDEEAFNEIVMEYRIPLTCFINRYVHDLEIAEDIAIDVFMFLLVHKYRYNFKTSLKTYLYTIGRSKALDYLKRKKKYIMIEYNDDYIENLENTSLMEEVILKERKEVLHHAIQKLPADMKEAICLVYLEELSYDETSKIMKKNKKQIDNLLYRAKKQLKEILEKEGEF